MSKEDPNIDYYSLISSYLSGNASKEDIALLEEWVLADEEHRMIFRKYKEAWIFSGMKDDPVQVNIAQQWEKTADQLFSNPKIVKLPVQKKRSLRPIWSAAAAIALLVIAGIWWFNGGASNDTLQVMAKTNILESKMPDGTLISLNQNATITYTNDYGAADRRVTLDGDAFFDVERDPGHPFIIQTPEVEIKVLGTSFYVDARKEQDEIQVIVKTGVVEVNSGSEKVQLKANETGVFSKKTKTLVKITTKDVNYLAWKTDALIFEDTNLEEVIFAINRKFHSQLSLQNPALKKCLLTATYKDKTLDHIIRILEQTLNLEATKKADQIILSGESCD